MFHRTVGQGQRSGAKIRHAAAILAEQLNGAAVGAAKVIQVHFRQQGGILGNIDGKVVRINFQIGIFSAYITNCFRHAEEIDQVIPFMDQVDGHAAAQGLVGTVHRAVIHPRPPVRQVGGTDHPRTVGAQAGQVIFQRQHGAAPAHGCSHIGFLPGGQQGGKVYIRLLGGNNGLFDKQRVCQAANFLQCLRVQAGGVGDKRQIVVRQGGGILQGGELAVQQFCRAGAQRAG